MPTNVYRKPVPPTKVILDGRKAEVHKSLKKIVERVKRST